MYVSRDVFACPYRVGGVLPRQRGKGEKQASKQAYFSIGFTWASYTPIHSNDHENCVPGLVGCQFEFICDVMQRGSKREVFQQVRWKGLFSELKYLYLVQT